MPETPGAYIVERRGTDSSGRPVYANRRMWAAWDQLVDRLGAAPTITQGAYMDRVPGGGASGSAGYHDAGGPFDLRTWDLPSLGLTESQVIRRAREIGWAAWLRNQQHGGFDDEHIHMTLLGDEDATRGIKDQEQQYRLGLDGFASRGPDYHWRPDPIPTFNYKRWLEENDDMALSDKVNETHTVKQVLNRLDRYIDNSAVRDQRILAGLTRLEDSVADDATKAQVREIKRLLTPNQEA